MWHPIRNYKNRKKLKEIYKEGLDFTVNIPSVKKFLIEVEFCLTILLEKSKLYAIETHRDPIEYIRLHIQDVIREAIIKAITVKGKVKI